MRVLAAAVIAFATLAQPAAAHQFLPPGLEALIPPRLLPLFVIKKPPPSLVERGRQIFETETFGGNGRTCSTCHARDENFTLSPEDVKRRPRRDPLFVHEQRPDLAALENAIALRERALILENLDGFDKPGVLRSSMHLFALALSTNPEGNVDVAATLGWSGDGSPGDGSLREFAVGAVVQHMTNNLDRVAGRDFRMPTAEELDALEAFQLSLGRRADLQTDPALPGAMAFRDANVTAGQALFHRMPSRQGTRRCGGCHTSGGALNDEGENEQRATGVAMHDKAPACLYPNVPGDGGFGEEPAFTLDRSQFCASGSGPVQFRGNQFFSTQSIVEAAMTAPFFHNNSANTLEEVVDHYRSDEFNDSITGAGNGFLIDDNQRNQIAAFLRAINVDDQIRAALEAISTPANLADARLAVRNAIEVLQQPAGIKIHQRDALPKLRIAALYLNYPQSTGIARRYLEAARSAIVR